MRLVEESCIASSTGDNRKALSKAKDASNKERSLIRLQEQSGLGDHHNIDLTYAVSITKNNFHEEYVVANSSICLIRCYLIWVINMLPMNCTWKQLTLIK